MNDANVALDLTTGPESELFLLRALDAVPPSRVEALFRDLMTAASRRMDRIVFETTPENVRSEAMADVMRRASLGLEYASEGDPIHAVRLVANSPASKLVNTGAALLDRLRQHGETVEANLVLRSDLPAAISALDELNLANTLETLVLTELTRARLVIDQATPRVTEVSSPRPIASVDDIRLAAEMLRHFEARIAIFRAFPGERLFAYPIPTDELGDSARIAVSRLFVRIALGASDWRFDMDSATVEMFRSLDPTAVAATLGEWIERFVADALASSEQPYGRAYLAACADALDDALTHLT